MHNKPALLPWAVPSAIAGIAHVGSWSCALLSIKFLLGMPQTALRECRPVPSRSTTASGLFWLISTVSLWSTLLTGMGDHFARHLAKIADWSPNERDGSNANSLHALLTLAFKT